MSSPAATPETSQIAWRRASRPPATHAAPPALPPRPQCPPHRQTRWRPPGAESASHTCRAPRPAAMPAACPPALPLPCTCGGAATLTGNTNARVNTGVRGGMTRRVNGQFLPLSPLPSPPCPPRLSSPLSPSSQPSTLPHLLLIPAIHAILASLFSPRPSRPSKLTHPPLALAIEAILVEQLLAAQSERRRQRSAHPVKCDLTALRQVLARAHEQAVAQGHACRCGAHDSVVRVGVGRA
eukprot:118093-Chlamydomonas_euryale.AAC.2